MNTRTLAAATLALGLTACAQQFNGVGLFAICAPPAPTVDTTSGTYVCEYPATCGAVLVSNPKLDATTAQADFRLPLQLNNQLVNNASSADGLVNTNDAYVQSFEMSYSGGPALQSWSTAASITVPAAGNTTALVPLIPAQDFSTIAPASPSATVHLIVSVRANGVYAAGESFSTAWFQVPVDVCSGCLAGTVCPAGVMASCPPPAPGQTSPGQTASVTCIIPQ